LLEADLAAASRRLEMKKIETSLEEAARNLRTGSRKTPTLPRGQLDDQLQNELA